MKKYANEDIKALMRFKNISQYELSLKLNVSSSTVFRMLQKELTQEQKQTILKAIDEMEG